MDWKLFAQLAATILVAILGGWLGHYLSSRRDLLNERRKLRVSYLIEAYRKLESGSNRDNSREAWKEVWPLFESAIADVQLLGSARQVLMARQFALDMAENQTASIDELIFDLRRSLRRELELEPVETKIVYMRFTR
jgi:hypothetical protein